MFTQKYSNRRIKEEKGVPEKKNKKNYLKEYRACYKNVSSQSLLKNTDRNKE